MYSAPSQTEKGVRYASYTMVIFLVVNIVSVTVVAAFIPIISDLVLGGGSIDTILGTLIGLVAVACTLIILELIGLILGLLAVIALHQGRNEFAPEHGKRLDKALIALAIGISLPIVGEVASTATTAAGIGGIGGLVPATTLTAAAVTAAFGISGAVFLGLFLLWAVELLNTPEGKTRGLIALVLGALAGVASFSASAILMVAVPVLTDPASFYLLMIPSILGGVLSIISIILWYLLYRGILGRFKSGELRPAPPMPMYAVPYPPMYMPPYAPAYPPPQPPAQPPTQPGTPPPNP